MKRILTFSLIGLLGVASISRAQNASAVADQQAAEERYKQLAGKIQDLQDTVDAQRKHITDLEAQIKEVREAQAKPDTNTATRDELRKLAEQVKDIDDKRAADKETIKKEIAALATAAPVEPTPKKPKAVKAPKVDPTPDTPAATPDTGDKNYEGYEHAVKSGETLTMIVTAYNKANGSKTTVDQVLKHPLNAGLKPEKLKVGQKIFIPAK
jgi:TolA-binding protein